LLIHLDSENFDDEVVYSELPVVIDFWAPWCRPCLAFAPTFEKMAKKYDGKIKFAKCNVEKARAVAEMLDVASIPTLIYFCSGRIIKRVVGSYDEKNFESVLEEFLKKCEDDED